MQHKHYILGVHLTDRIQDQARLQQLFTEYAGSIKTRLGLHDVREGLCKPTGVVLLEIEGSEEGYHEFARKLAEIEGVQAQEMVFDHPWSS